MRADILILSSSDGDELSKRLSCLVYFMGMSGSIVNAKSFAEDCVAEATSYSDERELPTLPNLNEYAGVFVAADTLLALPDLDISSFGIPVLVYGFLPCDQHVALAGKLSNGATAGITAVTGASKYQVSETKFASSFSGLHFGPTNSLLDSVFTMKEGCKVDSLVSIENEPFFVQSENSVFLLGVAGVANLDRLTGRMPSAASLFSTFVCFALFIRWCGDDVSLMPGNKNACVIIDDPLLRPRYGFVQYANLLDDMEKYNYAVSVSHIPKNYGMTKPQTAAFFKEHADRISVCIHGCDHMKSEFSTKDTAVLNEKVSQSLELMKKHETEAGVAWDRVMVFPHGLFSVESTKVLENNGVAAAVVSVDAIDSKSNPTGSRNETFHKISEFIKPFVSAYGGAPVFLRRYPKCVEEFAFDLFLGRPLIITTHHADFRNDGKSVNEFIDKLNKLEPNLKWTSLAEIVKECIVGAEVRDDGTVTNAGREGNRSGETGLRGGNRSGETGLRGGNRSGETVLRGSCLSEIKCLLRRKLVILRDNLMAWKEYLGEK